MEVCYESVSRGKIGTCTSKCTVQMEMSVSQTDCLHSAPLNIGYTEYRESTPKRFSPCSKIGWLKCSLKFTFSCVAEHCSLSTSEPEKNLLEELCSIYPALR